MVKYIVNTNQAIHLEVLKFIMNSKKCSEAHNQPGNCTGAGRAFRQALTVSTVTYRKQSKKRKNHKNKGGGGHIMYLNYFHSYGMLLQNTHTFRN